MWDENSKQFIDCDLNKGYLFKFKDETFEHLQIKKVSLNLKSSLLNQYFPIAFQFSIGLLIMR
jgi:hypothetical protein